LKRTAILTILIAFLFSVCIEPANAQQKRPENLPKYDLSPYHFGFTLGINTMNFIIKPVKDFAYSDTVYTLQSKAGSGFNIGIVSNLRLAEYLDLRFIPTLSFGERTLIFNQKINDTSFFDIRKKVESAFVDLPFELKFKSKRLYNSRAYVLTGVKFQIDLASQAKKKAQDEEIRIKLKKNDIAVEFGVGFDFYTTYFKFGTELKMAYGLRDMLTHENNVYANSISSLHSKVFQLTFTFE
jgi:hypothetical protein